MPFVGALRRNVLILAACQALMMSGSALIIATSALVGLALSKEAIFATLPVACMFVGTLMVTFPASVLMKRIGRRAGFIIGLMVGFVGAMVATWAIVDHNFVAFALGSFFDRYPERLLASITVSQPRILVVKRIAAGRFPGCWPVAYLRRSLDLILPTIPGYVDGNSFCRKLRKSVDSVWVIDTLGFKDPDSRTGRARAFWRATAFGADCQATPNTW